VNVDNRCGLCRGEAGTSGDQCRCAHAVTADRQPTDTTTSSSSPPRPQTGCSNCNSHSSSTQLCNRCIALPRCGRCRRHLPASCFVDVDSDTGDVNAATWTHQLCRACRRMVQRLQEPKVTARKTVDDIITEVPISTTETDRTFANFFERNDHIIRQQIDQHQQQHRYKPLPLSLSFCQSLYLCVYSNQLHLLKPIVDILAHASTYMQSALYVIPQSICLFARLSVTGVDHTKRLTLGLCTLHRIQ